MRLILLLLAFVFSVSADEQSVPSIAQLDIELDGRQTLPLKDTISFELITSRPEQVAKSLRNWQDIRVSRISDGSVSISMPESPLFGGPVSAKYSQDSFVIDISEDSTQQFISGFESNSGQELELDQLAAYINDYIDQPTYIHGFNIASVVATQRSGDCTEYAVMATALARALALPARVIIGTVIVEQDQAVSAFGHAWAEVWHDEQWQILDAALFESEANRHFYLPAAALDNEGPGFLMALAGSTSLMPTRIKGVRSL